MSSTIANLAAYGDLKGRDSYLRNAFHSVKGDGSIPNSITQKFYGIPSTTSTEYELMRFNVSEGAVDDKIGTFAVGLRDGTSLNEVLSLNNTASEITTTSLTFTSTDVFSTGVFNVGTIQKNNLAEGSRIELVSDVTDPAINFLLGDLDSSPSTPMIITEGIVAIEGVLTIDGTDFLDAITAASLYTSTGAVAQLKPAYTSLEVNVGNAYTTSVALDVNGSTRIRGNDLLFYDDLATNFYSALSFARASNEVRLRSSRAGDSLVLSTTNGVNNTLLNRLSFTDGAGTQEAIFSNVNVGIGTTPSGSYALEVAGNSSLTGSLLTGGNVDLAGNNVVNVTQIQSSNALAEQVRLVLTSHATTPSMNMIIGDLAGSPTTVATFSETAATLGVPVTMSDNLIVTGNLTVNGTTTTISTSNLNVEDVNIDLGAEATAHATINGGGFTLGKNVTGITIPSLTYSNSLTRWSTSVGLNVGSGNLTVGTTATLSPTTLDLRTSSASILLGALAEWKISVFTDVDGDHLTFAHDDAGNGVFVTKFDVLE